jgi:hypothetical protein
MTHYSDMGKLKTSAELSRSRHDTGMGQNAVAPGDKIAGVYGCSSSNKLYHVLIHGHVWTTGIIIQN